MGYIKKDKVEEIKDKSDIVSVVSDYVSLSKTGKHFLGRCPFHNDTDASFCVFPNTNSFHCFGCGKHGNSISFLMNLEGIDFLSAVTKLSEKFSIQLEYETNLNSNNNYDKYYSLNDFVAKFYYKKMLENVVPKKYLFERGISQKSINSFLIGYADGNWKSLVNELNEKNLDINIALELGLVIQTKTGDYIDRFRNRIIFPIINKYKKIIGFGGRTIVDDKAKYLNSPESIIFKKGHNLYAIDKVSDRNIRDKILVVEGYMDVISLYQEGINYAVAGLGTAFTENQAKLARQYGGNNIFICYDGDSAGIKATNRTYSVFEMLSVKPKIIKLSENLDPDDFIKKYGTVEFEKLLENSLDIYDFNYLYFNNLIKNADSIKEKSEIYTEILNFIDSIKNNILKENFIKKFSEILDIDEKSIKEDLKKVTKISSNSDSESSDSESNDIEYFSPQKILLDNNDKKLLILGIILMMRGNRDVDKYFEKLFYLSNECSMNEILSYVHNEYKDNKIILPNMLIDKFKIDDRNLKIVTYISQIYDTIKEISGEEFFYSLEMSFINVQIRKFTNNIELLRTMEQNEDIVKLLNDNINNLMILHEKLKNLRKEKGVYYE